MKIVYCINSIDDIGGIEIITVAKANYLADVLGHSVFILVTDHKGSQDHTLSSKVKLIPLGVTYYEHQTFSPSDILIQRGKRKKHLRLLREMLNRILPDIVISTGLSEKHLLPQIKGNWRLIREIHFNKYWRRQAAKGIYGYLRARLSEFYDYKIMINHYDRIVILTEEDKKRWKSFENVSVIPNPLRFETEESSSTDAKTVIAVGRLAEQKNYVSMIRAFRYVAERYPEWQLNIWGDGPLRSKLLDLIIKSGLEKNVFLMGATNDVRSKMLESSIYVMTSVYEGFALVLIEAMSCGLPLVTYDFPCGPKDILKDRKIGFLIPQNDEKKLADKIIWLIEHPDERKELGKNAKFHSQDYSLKKIMDKWNSLMNDLVSSK